MSSESKTILKEQADLFEWAATKAEVQKVAPLPPPPLAPTVYTVSQLSAEIKKNLSEQFSEVIVQGEIADFKGIHRSGHLYFALKDDKSQVRAVMWKGALQKVPFDVQGGLEVIVTGKIDYYGGSGSLQIVVDKMEPVGIGALQLKFEQLKEKLKAEGLFENSRKRKIKALNWRIGLITGRSTAALQDMLKIFKTRFPLAEIYLFHASVQGDKAPAEIISAIRSANTYSSQSPRPLDVLILGRGGGSYEDLFCFNDESLARAIVASQLPIVSAVGHEIDFTIADMVADKRAATPSHAAQECVPELSLWLDRFLEIKNNLNRQILDRIHDLSQRVDTLFNRITLAAPQKKLEAQKALLLQFGYRYEQGIRLHLERRKARLSEAAALLDALSPLKVLERGYSFVKSKEGNVIKSVQSLSVGSDISLRLSDGELLAKVTKLKSQKSEVVLNSLE